MMQRGRERSRVKAVQMDNLSGLLGVRRMDRVPNGWIRELCGVEKEVGDRMGERMEKDRIA